MNLETRASVAEPGAGKVILPSAPIRPAAGNAAARVILGGRPAPTDEGDLPDETTVPRPPTGEPPVRESVLTEPRHRPTADQPADERAVRPWASVRVRLQLTVALLEAGWCAAVVAIALIGSAPLVPPAWILAAAVPCWLVAALAAKSYRYSALIAGRARLAVPAGVLTMLLLASTPTSAGSVLVALAAGVCCWLAAGLVRAGTRRLIRRAWRAGRWLRRAIVVAGPPQATVLIEKLGQRGTHGLNLLGVCGPASSTWQGGVPPLGRTADAAAVALALNADMVVVDATTIRSEDLRTLSWRLERTTAALVMATGLVETTPERIDVLPTVDATLLGVRVRPTKAQLALKAAFDRVIGALLVLAFSPVLLGSILAVRLTSSGGAFFRQKRVGLHGELFTMWKLRTMYSNAEELRAALEQDGKAVGPVIKFDADPRITPVGRFMRKYSIDELPQLLNVAAGQMSLVGPRPALPDEVAKYRPNERRRLAAKPGMTGLWQVSGRDDLDWEESLKLDLRYVDNWTMGMDLSILAATIGAVLGGKGAY